MKASIFLVAMLSACIALAEDADKAESKNKKPTAEPDFSVVCSNAWLKCTSDKDPLAYAAGDEIKLEISFMGVTNAIPEGKYKLKWSAKGFSESEPEGSVELSKKPLVFTGKIAEPGFARLDALVVNADGKPFEKVVGKKKAGVSIACGVGADVASLLPPPEPKDFAKRIKDLKARLAKVPLKKVERVEIPSPGLGGVKAFNVTVPFEGETPVTGILLLPAGLVEGAKAPMRVEFEPCDLSKPQPMPGRNRFAPGEAAFYMAFQPKPKDARDEAYCTDLYLRVVRALQYVRTVPEWNGKDIDVRGWDFQATLSLWAAGCGEGVTSVRCGLLLGNPAAEQFDPALMARAIPASCLVDILRAGLGDDTHPPADTVRIWNAMKCDRKLLWVQGCSGWPTPPWYKGRDVLWEKLRPVEFRNMNAEHYTPLKPGSDNSFKDLEVAFTDKVVLEVVFNYEKPASLSAEAIGQLRYYAKKDNKPLSVYVTIPVRKIKDKTWAKFVELQGKSVSVPVYFDAGMAIPAPASTPWYHVLDSQGVLRYSGAKIDEVKNVLNKCYSSMPKPDPVFAYAKPVLLKDDVAKFAKAKLTGAKLYKAIEGLSKKYVRSDSDRSAEAAHLLVGMRQALDTRISEIDQQFHQRPGLAYAEVQALVKEWPEAEMRHEVKNFRQSAAKNPDVEKIAKLESELKHLRQWSPEKPSDIKKKDAALAALRAKAEKFSKSKVSQVQGEALSIVAEIDNPPQPLAQ